MTIGFERTTIIGVGLLGASLGLALKRRGMSAHITGVGRRAETLSVALQRGAVDEVSLDAASGADGADTVIIATPVQQVIPLLDLLLPRLSAHTLVMDVASAKGAICAHARKICPRPRRFIGCHPMAGGEKFGPEHGCPDFYDGTVCLMEQGDDLALDARQAARAFWTGVGARVVEVDADLHDAMLARTSHAPHVAAAALARLAGDFGATQEVVGNGFLDVTRIAGSRPEIWRDICLANREALAGALGELRATLNRFGEMLDREDGAGLETFFEAAVRARNKVISS